MEIFVDGKRWSIDRLRQELLDNNADTEADALDHESSDDESSPLGQEEIQTNSESECSADELSDTMLMNQSETPTESPGTSEDEPRKKKRATSVLQGKNDKITWYLDKPEKRGKRSQKNLVSHLSGPKELGKEVKTPIDAWNILISEQIIKKIVEHTNEEIEKRRKKTPLLQTYHEITDEIEVRACFGVLYLIGVQKSAHINLEELWSAKFGTATFRGTFSLKRFQFLLSSLRFDDRSTRNDRKKADKLAPIREIWTIFIANCCSNYTPFENCTIDEQLLGFRGKCPFRIYMASKPDKYGMKIAMMNDARTWYMVNALPYVGKVETEKDEAVPTYYVRKLSECIHGTGRNITVDNWFSSIRLFDMMLKQYKITMLGTLRKNHGEIPSSFLCKEKPGTVKSGYSDSKLLVSYTPKKNKVILLLSTWHDSIEIDEETSKPNVVLDYNDTKGGTDTFDQLCRTYTTARETRRWPMRFFFGMLDQSGVNAMILFKMNTPASKMARRDYLKELSWELINPFMKVRFEKHTMRRGLKEIMRGILGYPEEPGPSKPIGKSIRARCYSCPRSKDKKTNIYCSQCKLPVCEEHSFTEITCKKCFT